MYGWVCVWGGEGEEKLEMAEGVEGPTPLSWTPESAYTEIAEKEHFEPVLGRTRGGLCL